MFDLKTNVLIWGLLASTTMKSAVHPGLECVNTTPTCTRTDAHFSRAHLTMHNSYSTALFQCGHTALAKGEKEFVSRVRLHSYFHLACHLIVERSVCPFSSSLIVTYMPDFQSVSDFFPRLGAVDKTPVPPLTGVECLAVPWLIRPQTQVMSPTSTAT